MVSASRPWPAYATESTLEPVVVDRAAIDFSVLWFTRVHPRQATTVPEEDKDACDHLASRPAGRGGSLRHLHYRCVPPPRLALPASAPRCPSDTTRRLWKVFSDEHSTGPPVSTTPTHRLTLLSPPPPPPRSDGSSGLVAAQDAPAAQMTEEQEAAIAEGGESFEFQVRRVRFPRSFATATEAGAAERRRLPSAKRGEGLGQRRRGLLHHIECMRRMPNVPPSPPLGMWPRASGPHHHHAPCAMHHHP